MAAKRLPIDKRLEHYSMPEPNSGCQLWVGHANRDGYGVFRDDERRIVKAHRESWKHHKGPIPDGMHVCHKCDVRSCINPDHLFMGTDADNMADKKRKGRALYGESNGSKIKESTARAIFESPLTQAQIAACFGVSPTLVGNIKRRERWACIHRGAVVAAVLL